MEDLKPTVAVIVTVYNKSPYVRACIESVLVQSHAPVEFVVVDDGSTDGSWDLVESATAGSGATRLRFSNGGVSRARNLGLEACRARPDYLLFLDGDDVLLPDALQASVAHMEANRAAAMCYSVPVLIDDSGAVIGVDTDQVRWARSGLGRRRMRGRGGRDSARGDLVALSSNALGMSGSENFLRTDPGMGPVTLPTRTAVPRRGQGHGHSARAVRTCPPPAVTDAPISSAANRPSAGPLRGLAGGEPEVVECAAACRRSSQGQACDSIRCLRGHAGFGHRPSHGLALRVGTECRQGGPRTDAAPPFDGPVCRFGCAGSRSPAAIRRPPRPSPRARRLGTSTGSDDSSAPSSGYRPHRRAAERPSWGGTTNRTPPTGTVQSTGERAAVSRTEVRVSR